MNRLIAITGGIGAGKSVVSRMLRVMGYEVYDCDSRARRLMDNSDEIKRRLRDEISPLAVTAVGMIDRRRLSSVVFADPVKLERLNSIVHHAVIEDLKLWRCAHNSCGIIFVETAILYQSGLDSTVDEVWDVTAPDELRIRRVMNRNNCSRSEVSVRISSQSYIPAAPHPAVSAILNDDITALLPQIEALLARSIG